MLGEVVGLVIGLTAKLFGEAHSATRRWAKRLHPMVQLWLERYGRDFVLDSYSGSGNAPFPAGKLVLFLKQRYMAKTRTRFGVLRRSLLPAEGLRHLTERSRRPTTRFQLVSQKIRWAASRFSYHFGSDVRYIWESPRWYLMSRRVAASQPANLASSASGSA